MIGCDTHGCDKLYGHTTAHGRWDQEKQEYVALSNPWAERDREYAPQVVAVESAERWMDRPVKVNLIMRVTERTANTQSFYLDEDEARALIAALQEHLAGR